ncbi:MAG: hypothetical protein A2087_04520 [Spirochaetes bacterium GWD1_61_31]|nr:MAG: hypothetical protein A2Y37_06405 [Spirochaetes bacterium GWB1_60_80]OHD40582.1 MAG: hypothetical protein A2087_04520 [Spirochaetes bacterium GWD1_61_31]OHD59287.1 MAG: hypothetical protein A2Y32_09815 [Spirochaetes bacterium GWF1_60_12]HAP44582.1 hypothetical protein [Spirochaetaceae bacterium]HAX36486.1 hypothetical protein [Spirochaetaceae bacterium]
MNLPEVWQGLTPWKRRLVATAVAILAASLLMLLIAALSSRLSVRRPGRAAGQPALEPVARSSDQPELVPPRGPALMRLLLPPKLGLWDQTFPTVREPKTRYTEEDVAANLPAIPLDVIESLRAKRKEQLETILSAVD